MRPPTGLVHSAALSRWVATIALLCSTATVPPSSAADACGRPPEVSPATVLEALRLPERPRIPSVYHALNGYTLYVRPDDLLAVLISDHRRVDRPGDLADSLRKQLPLSADISTAALIDGLDPESVNPEDKIYADRRRSRIAQRELGYALAKILEQRNAAVVDTSSGQPMISIQVERYSDGCSRGRRFRIPEGREILHIVDGIQ